MTYNSDFDDLLTDVKSALLPLPMLISHIAEEEDTRLTNDRNIREETYSALCLIQEQIEKAIKIIDEYYDSIEDINE